jgi:hypothetical protein
MFEIFHPKDHWLDNIDWVKVNSQTVASKNLIESEDNMDIAESLTIFNPIPIYKEILSILSPQETVCLLISYVLLQVHFFQNELFVDFFFRC